MVNGSSHTQNKGQTDRETDDRATIHKYRFVSNQVDLCCVYPARNPETHPPRATNTEQQMNIANSLNIVLAFRCEQIRIAVPVCPHRVCVFAKSANELRLCLHSVIRTGQDQGSVHIGMRTPPRGTPLCSSLPHPPPLCVINARQVLRFGRLSNIYQKLQTIQNKKNRFFFAFSSTLFVALCKLLATVSFCFLFFGVCQAINSIFNQSTINQLVSHPPHISPLYCKQVYLWNLVSS